MIKVAIVLEGDIKAKYRQWKNITRQRLSDADTEECVNMMCAIYDCAIESIKETHSVEHEHEHDDVGGLLGNFFGVTRDTEELFVVENGRELLDGCGRSRRELFMKKVGVTDYLWPVLLFESHLLDADTALGEWFHPVARNIANCGEITNLMPMQLLAVYSQPNDGIHIESYLDGALLVAKDVGVDRDKDHTATPGYSVEQMYQLKKAFFIG